MIRMPDGTEKIGPEGCKYYEMSEKIKKVTYNTDFFERL